SPLTAESFDAATGAIRRLWPVRARLVRVAARPAVPLPGIVLEAALDAPLRATVALMGARSGTEVRIARSIPPAADSAHARAGGVLLWWPRDPGATWITPPADTVGAVIAGDAVVVARFLRRAAFTLGESPGRPVAQWADG